MDMFRRQFSTSSAVFREFKHVTRRRVAKVKLPEVGEPITRLPDPASKTPLYPYGAATVYKQSDRGLYGGKIHQIGHQISEFGNRHKRVFHLNTQRVHLYSEALERSLPIRVVASTLKTITREGGVDEYLIKDTPQRIKSLGTFGWDLRYKIIKALELKKKNHVSGQTLDGKTLYGELEQDGEKYGISAGRQSMLRKLWSLQEPRPHIQGWLRKNGKLTHIELVQKLEALGVDMSETKHKLDAE